MKPCLQAHADTGLRRELAACLAMTRLAYFARAGQGSNWLSWTFLALAIVIPAIAFAISKKLAMSVGWGGGVPLTFLVALWWTLLVSSLVSQNQHTARLVPGSGRRAVAVMLCSWVVITAMLTLLFVLAGGNPLLGFLLAGLALSLTAAAMCVRAMGWLLYVVVMAFILLGNRLEWLWSFAPKDTLITISPLPIMVLGYVALRAMYKGWPQATGLHSSLQSRAKMIDALLPGWSKGANRSSGFARRLRRDCAEGRIDALLMHGLGHLANAPSLTFFVGAMVFPMFVVCAAPGWVGQNFLLLRALVPALMAAMQIVIGFTMVQAVYRRHREQALVRLAPRVPGAHLLNASLARSLLREYGRCWLGATSLALVFLYFLGVPGSILLRYFAVFLVTLTWANLLLRDYASASSGQGLASMTVVVTLAACILTLLAPFRFLPGAPWLLTGAGFLAMGITIARLRWHQMLRAPAAFPAGRMY